MVEGCEDQHIALIESEGRKVSYFMALNSFPVIVFAVFFYGGAIGRYLLLYPAPKLPFQTAQSHAQFKLGAMVTPGAMLVSG